MLLFHTEREVKNIATHIIITGYLPYSYILMYCWKTPTGVVKHYPWLSLSTTVPKILFCYIVPLALLSEEAEESRNT